MYTTLTLPILFAFLINNKMFRTFLKDALEALKPLINNW